MGSQHGLGQAAGASQISAVARRLRHLSTSTWTALAELASTESGMAALDRMDGTGHSGTDHLAAAHRSLTDTARAARRLRADSPPAPALEAGGDDAAAGGAVRHRAPSPAGSDSALAPGGPPAPLVQVTWICRAADDLAAVLEHAVHPGTSTAADEDSLVELAAGSIVEAEHHVARALALATKAVPRAPAPS